MKFLTCCLLAMCFVSSAHGRSNFMSNPDLPYPPGCAGDPARTMVPFLTYARVVLHDPARNQELEVRLDGFRSTCSEPGRSLIWLRFDAVHHGDLNFRLELPGVRVTPAAGGARPMSLAATPNGWGSGSDPQLGRQYLENTVIPDWMGPVAPAEISGLYVLDNTTPMYNYPNGPLSADDYNGAITVELVYPPDTIVKTFQVPATADLFGPESGIPFSGRLSGMWVVAGANDQGMAISISNRVGADITDNASRDDLPLVLFLAQYSYDSEGNLLWLTGSADFEQGSNDISLDMVRVQNGEFMGDKPASREPAGTVRLVARSCDDITFEFDYAQLGMGSGSYRLQRLYSLETAGYDCRDYAAKVAANQ
jgi:hypothetical protein